MVVLTVEPDVNIELRDGETVLAGLYRQGYAYRIGCRRGGCGICKVDLVTGSVAYPVPVADTVLGYAERNADTCLSCRAVPLTDITIALRGERLTRNSLLANLRLGATEPTAAGHHPPRPATSQGDHR